jgi:hypothetical protein
MKNRVKKFKCAVEHFPHKYSIARRKDGHIYIIDDTAFEPRMYKNIKNCECTITSAIVYIPAFEKDVEIIQEINFDGMTYINIRRSYAMNLT